MDDRQLQAEIVADYPLVIREQPHCAACGHRRIHHFHGTSSGVRLMREYSTLCAFLMDGYPCCCDEYRLARPRLRALK